MTSPLPRRRGRKLRGPGIVAAHWHEIVLGTDGLGTWAVVPAGEPTTFAGGDVARYGGDIVRFYPHGGWWAAQTWEPGHTNDIVRADGSVLSRVVPVMEYVDVCTPAVADEEGMSYVDLILDVERDARGLVHLRDADEIETESVRWGVPPEHVERARVVAAEVLAAMRAGAPPFDGSAARWLGAFRAG